MGSRRSEVDQQRDSGQHVHPVLGWMEEGKQPPKEEFLPESPATEDSAEQGETLHGQDSVLQKGMEDAAREHTWLLVNLFSLQVCGILTQKKVGKRKEEMRETEVKEKKIGNREKWCQCI